MRTLIHQCAWEAKLAFRRSSTWVILGLLLGAGIVSIVLSGQRSQARTEEFRRLEGQFSEQIAKLSKRYANGENAGYWGYYTAFPVASPAAPLAALSQGVEANAPSVNWVRLLGIEPQLYEGGIHNPLLQTLGGLDPGFVMIVLAPLALLLMGHDVLSRDRSLGVHPLVMSHVRNRHALIWIRLLVRSALVFAITALIHLLAVFMLRLPLDLACAKWLLTAWLGLLPWVAITAVLAVRLKSPQATLSGALGMWVTLVWILPCSINLLVSSVTDAPEGMELTIRQRQVMHDGWDQDRKANYRLFLERHPEWRHLGDVPAEFSWRWYYAMHEVADQAVSGLAKSYVDRLQSRSDLARRLSWFVPTCYTQLLLANQSGTDLDSHLRHLAGVRRFHEELKGYFFPRIFHDRQLHPSDTDGFPRHRATPEPPSDLPSPLPLLLAAALPLVFYPYRKFPHDPTA